MAKLSKADREQAIAEEQDRIMKLEKKRFLLNVECDLDTETFGLVKASIGRHFRKGAAVIVNNMLDYDPEAE